MMLVRNRAGLLAVDAADRLHPHAGGVGVLLENTAGLQSSDGGEDSAGPRLGTPVAVAPNLALQPGYSGWIPGLDVRLWGLGSNPNSIGPLAVLALLLEYVQPTRIRSLRLAVVLSALVVVVLAVTALTAAYFTFCGGHPHGIC